MRVILLAALLVGCGPAASPGTLAGLPDRPARLALHCGVGVWLASIAALPEVKGVRVVASLALDGRRPTNVDDSTAAYWRPGDATITFYADKLGNSPQRWCRYAAHELGHAMGLKHASAPALMNSEPSVACVTPNDVEACTRAGLECTATCEVAE